jgi:hypothetical protein
MEPTKSSNASAKPLDLDLELPDGRHFESLPPQLTWTEMFRHNEEVARFAKPERRAVDATTPRPEFVLHD